MSDSYTRYVKSILSSYFLLSYLIFRPRQRGLRHELSSAAGTLGLWIRVPLKPYVCMYVCMEVVCVNGVLGR